MNSETAMVFFHAFNFDTLLALISCIACVGALFLGGKSYHNCEKIQKSFNDQKQYKDSSIDKSQKAGGNIYNQNCDVNALAKLTTQNFEVCLKQAYTFFEQKTCENLHQIIDETKRIIQENKIDIGIYTKIDWINVYFECAKNSSDLHMQNIWAKVLAKELEVPNSFSYKTLDILKNLSDNDFKLFENLCSLQIDGFILAYDFIGEYVAWNDLLKMREFGLISLDRTSRSFHVSAKNQNANLFCNFQFIIFYKNDNERDITVTYPVYLLTSAAKELNLITPCNQKREYVIDIAKKIKKQCISNVTVELHEFKNSDEFVKFDDGIDLLAE